MVFLPHVSFLLSTYWIVIFLQKLATIGHASSAVKEDLTKSKPHEAAFEGAPAVESM
jgi:hypothetical protein